MMMKLGVLAYFWNFERPTNCVGEYLHPRNAWQKFFGGPIFGHMKKLETFILARNKVCNPPIFNARYPNPNKPNPNRTKPNRTNFKFIFESKKIIIKDVI